MGLFKSFLENAQEALIYQRLGVDKEKIAELKAAIDALAEKLQEQGADIDTIKEQLAELQKMLEVLDELDFETRYKAKQIENIPSEGKIVIIANHPIGSLDALALINVLAWPLLRRGRLGADPSADAPGA